MYLIPKKHLSVAAPPACRTYLTILRMCMRKFMRTAHIHLTISNLKQKYRFVLTHTQTAPFL